MNTEATPVSTPGTLPARCSRPVWLHVSHHWGGGIQRWIDDFAAADAEAWHLVLRSRADRNQVGAWLELADLADGSVLLQWSLDAPIGSTAIHHAGYAAALASIVQLFDVRAVLVSSLVGHALDALDSGLPTAVVLHDLYPFCPALFGWFGEACTSCGDARLSACLRQNPLNVFWHQPDVGAWQALRPAWAERLAAAGVHLVAPSADVHARCVTLLPALATLPWTRIGHGLAGPGPLLPAPPALEGRRLRVLVPGRLNAHKGLDLLRAALPALTGFADVLLLGCGTAGAVLASHPAVEVVPDYAPAELAQQVAKFAPDCAALLSIVPESFSYTLSEMWALGVPVLATRGGAFAERIADGETGFLVEADTEALVGRLRALAAQPSALATVRARLAAQPVRTAADMVADYRALLGAALRTEAPHVQYGLLAGLRALAAQRQRDANELAEAARMRTELGAAMRALRDESARAERLQVDNAALAERLREAHAQRADVEAYRDAILQSTSWRLTAPLRRTMEAIGKGAGPAPATPRDAAETPPPAPPAPPESVLSLARGNPLLERLAARWADEEKLPCVAEGDAARQIVVNGTALSSALAAAVVACRGALQADRIDARALQFRGAAESEAVAPHAAPGLEVIVPAAAQAKQAERLFPGAQVRVQPWQWSASPVDADVRERLRGRLFVPDASVMVLGVGRTEGGTEASTGLRGGLAAFARHAQALAAQHTGLIWVWLGSRDEAAGQGTGVDAEPALAAAEAERRLFVIESPDLAEVETWLAAADLCLACGPAGVFDAGAACALARGLPVAAFAAGILPDDAPGAGLLTDSAALLQHLRRLIDWMWSSPRT